MVHTPQVSVLIRTMGRASLAKAIDSVVRQTWSNWELILVNASGKPIADVWSARDNGRMRCLQPGVALGRSEAANALLQVASGQYALFLDDDDWLEPGHLAKLFAALKAEPQLIAAYSDVQTMKGAGEKALPESLMASDFDLVRLQIENYLPLNSVLFSLGVVRREPVCTFDVGLKLFEGWDFLLQLAARGPFKRVPGATAIYVSGTRAADAYSSEERQRQLERLASRQLERWTPGQVALLTQRLARQTEQLNVQLKEVESKQDWSGVVKKQLQSTEQRAFLLQHMVSKLETLSTQQRQEIERLEHSASQQKADIQRLENISSQQRQEIERLEQLAARQQQEIAHMGQLAAQQQQKVGSIGQKSSQQQQEIARLTQFSVKRQQESARLEQLAAQLQQKILDLEALVSRQQRDITGLDQVRREHVKTLERFNERLVSMQQSLSWRVTRPLRSLARLRAKVF